MRAISNIIVWLCLFQLLCCSATPQLRNWQVLTCKLFRVGGCQTHARFCRLDAFAKTDYSGLDINHEKEHSMFATFSVKANGAADQLIVEAKACMRYMDAELHPDIGNSILKLQQELAAREFNDDGVTAVAALLHLEKFYVGSGAWGPLVATLGTGQGLPAMWDAPTTKILSMADLDMAWFEVQRQVTEMQAKLIIEYVVQPNAGLYDLDAGSADEEQQKQLQREITWALAIVRGASLPPAFSGDAVALCPIFHAIQHSERGVKVQHTLSTLGNMMGQTRQVVDQYKMPLGGEVGSVVSIQRRTVNTGCTHEEFYLFGTIGPKKHACIPLKILVPGLADRPPALAVLRRSAMVNGGLVTKPSSEAQPTVFNLQPSSPFSKDMMRLLRLSHLQFGDAE